MSDPYIFPASGAVAVPPTIVQHFISKTHDEWKYTIELVVGPADARWRLVARGDDLDEVMADLKRQRELMQK